MLRSGGRRTLSSFEWLVLRLAKADDSTAVVDVEVDLDFPVGGCVCGSEGRTLCVFCKGAQRNPHRVENLGNSCSGKFKCVKSRSTPFQNRRMRHPEILKTVSRAVWKRAPPANIHAFASQILSTRAH
jgi:hypothetical protein